MAKSDEKETKKPRKKKTIKKEKEIKIEEKKIEEKEVVKEETEKKVKKKTTYKTKDAIIIMILSMIIGFGIGYIISSSVNNKDSKSAKDLKELTDTYDEITEDYYGTLDKSNILYSSMNGLISGLNDRYAVLNSDLNSISNYEESIEGKFNGLGVYIMINEEGKIVVTSVFEDSPAQKSGIQANDIITSLNGKSYDTNNYDEFSYNIKSAELGSTMEIELLRDGDIVKVELKTDVIEVESVSLYYEELNEKNVGVFVINNFANNTYDQFMKKYNEAKENNIDAIVLDLRNNTEGKMEIASKIAGLFLDKNAVIYQNVRENGNEEIINENEKVINLPVVSVINCGTISTAEMLASTLNENLYAPIVGITSGGKGYLQKMIPLSNGKSVMYSIGEWVTSKGTKVEGIGIAPTVEIEGVDACGDNTQIEKAVEIIVSQ